MNCERCNSPLSYGSKYCNTCGEKVPSGTYDAEYKETIWAKIDTAKDKYDTLFLKKITGSVLFKILSLVAVLAYFFFTMYGNVMGIRLTDSEAYSIQYNKERDEYYISAKVSEAQLDLYVPFGTDNIVFSAFCGDVKAETKTYTTDRYRSEGYTINEGEYDYILVEAMRKGKACDKVKIIVLK